MTLSRATIECTDDRERAWQLLCDLRKRYRDRRFDTVIVQLANPPIRTPYKYAVVELLEDAS